MSECNRGIHVFFRFILLSFVEQKGICLIAEKCEKHLLWYKNSSRERELFLILLFNALFLNNLLYDNIILTLVT